MNIELYEENSYQPLEIKPIILENYFEFENLKKKKYILKINYKLGID